MLKKPPPRRADLDTLPRARARYTPRQQGENTYAVIGVELEGTTRFCPTTKMCLNTIAAEAAGRLREFERQGALKIYGCLRRRLRPQWNINEQPWYPFIKERK